VLLSQGSCERELPLIEKQQVAPTGFMLLRHTLFYKNSINFFGTYCKGIF